MYSVAGPPGFAIWFCFTLKIWPVPASAFYKRRSSTAYKETAKESHAADVFMFESNELFHSRELNPNSHPTNKITQHKQITHRRGEELAVIKMGEWTRKIRKTNKKRAKYDDYRYRL